MENKLVWTKEARRIAAACWIATGVIGLVAQFDMLPTAILGQLWKLWPLIPLGVGIAALLGSDEWGGFGSRR
jgi:hypothetical protein